MLGFLVSGRVLFRQNRGFLEHLLVFSKMAVCLSVVMPQNSACNEPALYVKTTRGTVQPGADTAGA